ncbi:neutral zinc metallopeptidase [Thiopseudomonas denitrificans]|uniref:Neutral zinc metallopeptidase n=1 Tax=Thiopseudomonas denitrificans TaxID=1501432 RepID=A0A4R6TUX3_9GAMM|nr:neutral zinc metallopeptidase [Thiopseudomonas denitrificans]TDQ35474.1 hypothetical protein DFQ45_11524 [Thiopseudomonas denitrificans]
MRWEDRRRSDNVDDRRGQKSSPINAAMGGGIAMRLLPVLLKTKGGRTLLLLGVLAFFGARMLGIDLMPLLTGEQVSTSSTPAQLSAEQQRLGEFVSVILADTEDTWTEIFAKQGQRYPAPTLVLFSGHVQSACGSASAAVGPFYCPADRKVYIDLSFYHDLKTRYKAPGDFAQAYVIAHEVGHHIQTITGISAEVRKAQQGLSKAQQNQLSVRQELQADCFAGVWGHHADRHRQMLAPGEMQQALNAAAAIGDDRLQKQATGTVTPDSFTHGTSEQRMRWFKRGFDSGDMAQCDTFKAGTKL